MSHQQMPQEPEETSQHHRDREENEDIGKNPTDTEGDLISTQRELPARRASIDSERPNLPAGGHVSITRSS